MKNILPFLALFISFLCLGQTEATERVFHYSKLNDVINLKNDSGIVIFQRYKQDNGIRAREAKVNEKVYRLSFVKDKNKKSVKEITTTDGSVVASIYNSRDIELEDHSHLTFKKLDGKNWVYLKENKEVLKGEFRKINGQKQLVVKNIGLNEENEAIMSLICLENGTSVISKKATAPVRVLLILALVGMRSFVR